MAYNEFPQNLYINDEKIDWENMKEFPDAKYKNKENKYGIVHYSASWATLDSSFFLYYWPSYRIYNVLKNRPECMTDDDWNDIASVIYLKDKYCYEVIDYFKNKNNAILDLNLLMGYILNNVISFRDESGTGITARQIELLMKRIGFSNVKRYCSSSFTTKMVAATSDMLEQGKPVYISALPKGLRNGLENGHSWVIDGAKYSGNEYLFHFNMGWQGRCNGYYNIECLNPATAKEYDYQQDSIIYSIPKNYTPENEYTWHFRLITYSCDKTNSPAYWYF